MLTDFITIAGFASTGITLFLGAFYLLQTVYKADGYTYLYLLLLFLGYELFYKTLIHSELIYRFSVLYTPGRYYNHLLYPVLLFFVYSVTRSPFRMKLNHWLVIAALGALILYQNHHGFLLSITEKQALLDRFYADTRPGAYNYWLNFESLLNSTLIPVTFLLLASYEYFVFRRRNANLPKQTLLNILVAILVAFYLFHQFSNLIYRWAYQASDFSMIEWPVDIIFLSCVGLLLAVVALQVNGGASFLPPLKYASSPLDQKKYAAIISQLTAFIKREELFLQTDLSIKDLAQKMHSNPSYLSQAINHHLGIGFKDYINQFRIDKARQALLDPQNALLTIEAIGQQCGFQSKSTFFRAFKKETQLTPKQYVDQKRSSN